MQSENANSVLADPEEVLQMPIYLPDINVARHGNSRGIRI